MPGLISHYLFGEKVLNEYTKTIIYLPTKINTIKSNISKTEPLNIANIILKNPGAYHIGLPGPDIFFYHLPSLIGKKSNNIGSIMHNQRTGEFFNIYIDYMNKLKPKAKEIAVAYLSGFLCHYSLDSIAHPYIYYRCGFAKMPKLVKIHEARHRSLETQIDTFLLKKLKDKKVSTVLPYKVFDITKKESQIIFNLLTKVINKTYQLNITSKYLYNVHFAAKKESKLLNNHEFIRSVLSYIERITVHFPLITSLMPSDNIKNHNDCLNEKKKTWYLPWNNHSPCDKSFMELFNLAAENTISLLQLLDNFLYHQMEKELLLKKIGNNSYYTGIDCNMKTAV